MNRFWLGTHFWLLIFYAVTSLAQATVHEDFKYSIGKVRDAFLDRYALYEHKARFFGWDIRKQHDLLLSQGMQQPQLSVEQARMLVTEFVQSARDYHARAILAEGQKAELPLQVRSASGRFFATQVKASGLSIRPGDEILSLNSEPIREVILGLMNLKYPNYRLADLRDAERVFSTRWGILLEPLPTSPIARFQFRTSNGQTQSIEVPWTLSSVARKESSIEKGARIPIDLMGWNSPDRAPPPGQALPPPQRILWQPSPSPKYFSAWIGELKNKKRVGMIRIPTFAVGARADYTAAIAEFESLVAKMNQSTDALILDVQSNSGGMVDYAYALASHFLLKPAKTPYYQYRLFAGLVDNARTQFQLLSNIRTLEQAKEYFGGSDYFGYPVSLQFALEVKAFMKGILDDAAQGRKLGKPRHYNAAMMLPHPRVVYKRPLFVTIDEKTASSGDTFAAIMKDERRATLIGTRTAGAGAFTGGTVKVENKLGFGNFIIPLALQWRANGLVVENVGIQPDVLLKLSVSDFREASYQTYADQLYSVVARGTL